MQANRHPHPYKRVRFLTILSLFTSTGTLICCALPALLITLGMGMTLASLTVSLPWLFSLSRYKGIVFIAAGILLGISFYLIFVRSKKIEACETGSACDTAAKYSRSIFWMSVVIYLIGISTAYVYLPLKLYLSQ
jgi:mercuric ion transport protein